MGTATWPPAMQHAVPACLGKAGMPSRNTELEIEALDCALQCIWGRRPQGGPLPVST